jgi:diguanylate cyclase (GGDEF)-like protein
VARYGGEEFALILPETTAAQAARLAELVRLAISGQALPHPTSPVAPVLTVSVGVSTATLEWCSKPDQLVAAADQALYEAKMSGRNRVEMARRERAPQEAANAAVLGAA